MLRVALKGLLGHKVRFVMTAIAVVLGVAFVSGTFVLTDSMNDAFSGLFDDIFAETDVYVRAENPIAEDLSAPPQVGLVPTLPEEIVEEVRAVDGVNAAFGGVAGYAQFLDGEGEPIGGMGPPTFGFSWSDDDPTVTLRTGEPPAGPNEVVMDAATAEDNDFAVGDQVHVLLNQGVQTFTVSGIVGFGEADNLLGATIAGFDHRTAQELFDKQGRIDEVAVIGGPGVDAEDLRDRIEGALAGRDVEVTTSQAEAEEQQEGIDAFLGIFNTVLLAFGGVALFVGAFIIANTFTIVVAQRTREFALLRAVGASSNQVRAAIMVEALVLGVLASLAGLLLGVGVAALLKGAFAAFGIDIPSGGTIIAPRTIGVAFAVGIGVTFVASLFPSFRAAKVAPIEAMRGLTETNEGSTRRNVIGVVVTVLGMASIFVGLFIGLGDALILVGAGAAATMLGIALAAPLLAGPFVLAAGRLLDRFGMPGRLAQRNAHRSPSRTASTASALMIGLALVTFVTILAASINAGISDALDEQFQADFILSSEGAAGFGFLPTGVAAELAESPELGAVSPTRLVPYAAGDDAGTAVAVDVAAIDELLDLGVVEGEISALGTDEVFLSVDELEVLELEVGDEIDLTFPDGATVEAPIVGSFENADFVGSQLVMSLETSDLHAPNAQDVSVMARASGDVADGRTAVEEILEGYPGVQVQDQGEFRETTEQSINQILMLMIVLLALALFIALLGITNTLALAVFERTREIGLLRAVGMDRRQTTRMILWESLLISVFGALLGLAVGIFFGWALLQAFAEEGFEGFRIPVLQLVIYVVVAGLAGVAAAVAPGWRAARVDVLEAVTTE